VGVVVDRVVVDLLNELGMLVPVEVAVRGVVVVGVPG